MNILLLGNDDLRDFLTTMGNAVYPTETDFDCRLNVLVNNNIPLYDYIISYGYAKIITQEVIEKYPGRIINLHIGYLPYNRGADPQLWAMVEGTPQGVTIHHIDAGIDTGNIIAQKKVDIDYRKLTMNGIYKRLHAEIRLLFCDIWPDFIAGKIKAVPQRDDGTYHKMADKLELGGIRRRSNVGTGWGFVLLIVSLVISCTPINNRINERYIAMRVDSLERQRVIDSLNYEYLKKNNARVP